MHLLRSSILILGVIQITLIGSYIYSLNCGGPDWLKDISLNVGTEVLGIFLTVWLIDTVIRKKEQSERERVMNVAFSQLRLPLRHHITMLVAMYKGALAHAPQPPPRDLTELFGPEYAVQVAFLDFAKPAPLMNVLPLNWFDYFHFEIEKFNSALSRTIEKYATFLDPETVELLEALLASSLLSFLSQSRAIPPIHKQQGINCRYNLLAGQGVSELIRQHTTLVEQLVELANRKLPQDKTLGLNAEDWRNDIAPKFGSARL